MPSFDDEFADLSPASKTVIIKMARHKYLHELHALYETMSPNYAYLTASGMLQAANQMVAAIMSEENYRLWYNATTDLMIDDHSDVVELRAAFAKEGKL